MAASDCTSLDRLVFLGDWIGSGWITSPGGPWAWKKKKKKKEKQLFFTQQNLRQKYWCKYSQEVQEDQLNRSLLLDQQDPGIHHDYMYHHVEQIWWISMVVIPTVEPLAPLGPWGPCRGHDVTLLEIHSLSASENIKGGLNQKAYR